MGKGKKRIQVKIVRLLLRDESEKGETTKLNKRDEIKQQNKKTANDDLKSS